MKNKHGSFFLTWLAVFFSLLFSLQATAACSSWLDKAWFNELFPAAGGGDFLEVYSNDRNFPAAWQGWTIDVYDRKDQKMIPTVTLNNNTAFACTKAGNKTWVTHNTSGLSGNLGLVILKDAAGAYVDAFAFDNKAPPDAWANNTSNFLPALVAGCPTLASRLTTQAGNLGSNYNQLNMLRWSSQGNKDYSRMPDGTGIWYNTAGTGSGTTYTTCTSNNANLTKTINTTTAPPGGTVKYILTLVNPSGSTITGTLSIVDPLPTGLTFVSAVSTNTGDTVSHASGTVTWTPANLGSGSRTTLTITATVPANATIGSVYTNTATTTGTALGTKQQSDTVSFTVVAPTTRSFLISPSTQTSCIGATGAQRPLITITAKDQINGTGNTLTTYVSSGTVTLGTSSTGNTAVWTKNSGAGTLTRTASGATYNFVAADQGVASFYLTDTVAETIDLTATDYITDAPNTMAGVFSAIEFKTSCTGTLVSIGTPTPVSEGNTAGTTTSLVFPVTLSTASGTPVTVSYSTSNLTATGGASCTGTSDYQNTSGTLSIAAGTINGTIAVPICGDTRYEGDETLTVTLSNPSTNASLGVATATGTIREDDSPPLKADYRMDEVGWSGTGAVLDSSSNGYNATASGAAPADATRVPAFPGSATNSTSPSTCGYGVFTGSGSQVPLPAALTTLPATGIAGYTVSAWARVGGSTDGGRIVGNSDATNGWSVNLNGSTLSLNKSGVTFSYATGGTFTATTLTASSSLATGTWYFIALTVDTNSKSVVLYAYDSAGASRARITATYTGTWAAPAAGSLTTIGGSFNGWIDEVRFYDGPLAIASIEGIRGETHACTLPLDHVEFIHDGAGLTCIAEEVTVVGCPTSASCATTPQYDKPFTITPTAIPGAQWCLDISCTTPITGSATLSSNSVIFLKKTTPGTVTLGGTVSSSTYPGISCRNTQGNPSCQIAFADLGFTFAVPDFTAGSESSFTIHAQSKDDTTQKCVNFIPSGNIKMWATYVNPSSGTKLATLKYENNDYSLPISEPPIANIPVKFNNLGQAFVSLNYLDVGEVRLDLKWDSAVGNDNFVVSPHTFLITDIKNTVTGGANLAAADAQGHKFIGAGEKFTANITAIISTPVCSTYTARTALNENNCITPNFGNELGDPATGAVKLEHTKIAPTPGEKGELSGTTTLPRKLFQLPGAEPGEIRGSATVTDLTWNEVGIITLTSSLTDGPYLGAGSVIKTPTGNIGRFTPSYFTLSDISTTNGCGSPFTYFDQDGFTTTFKLTARNAYNTPTKNYEGNGSDSSWAKLPLNDWALFGFTVKNWLPKQPTGSTLKNSATPPTATATKTVGGIPETRNDEWLEGTTTVIAKHQISRPPLAPPLPQELAVETKVVLSAIPGDSDGITVPTAVDLIFPPNPTATLRHGRARLLNANGSELLDLPMPFRTEYWDGSRWVRNTADRCTGNGAGANTVSLSMTNVNLSGFTTASPFLPCIHDDGTTPGASGRGCVAPVVTSAARRYREGNDLWPSGAGYDGQNAFNLWLAAPGAGHAGAVDVTAQVPAWLRFNWTGAGDANPTARATFGTVRSGSMIYRREMY